MDFNQGKQELHDTCTFEMEFPGPPEGPDGAPKASYLPEAGG
jgi:hypothetical protein